MLDTVSEKKQQITLANLNTNCKRKAYTDNIFFIGSVFYFWPMISILKNDR